MSDTPAAAPAENPPETLHVGPDLAGICVDDVEGKPAGEIFGSLADARSGLIRYVDVALYEDALHVLVPIGHARLRRDLAGLRFRLRAATRDDLRAIPASEPGRVPDEPFERDVLSAHARIFHGARYYAHPAYDHAHIFAGENPVVRAEDAAQVDRRAEALAFLSGSGFRVVDDEPDITGWPLLLADGREYRIADLVIDTEAGKVRDVVLEADGKGEVHIVPIGYVELNLARRVARVPALDSAELPRVPAPSGDAAFDRADEEAVLHHLAALDDGLRRYERPDFRLAGASDQSAA
jgi:hypothetical protein